MAVFSAQDWPGFFRPLLSEYGPAAVWCAGWDALGYPPTWCDRFPEFEAVRLHLLHTRGF